VTGPWGAFAEGLQREARDLFRTGTPLGRENESRYLDWCERWTRATGRQPDLIAYVVQRARGLVFPVRPLGRRRLQVRTVGEPRP